MIYSMTGFGKASKNYRSKDINVEIRSLNSKYMDISIKCPLLYKEKEIEIRKLLTEMLIRGKTELTIAIVAKKGEEITIDEKLIISLYNSLVSIDKKLNKKRTVSSIDIEDLLHIPNVIKPKDESLTTPEWTALQNTIKEAINSLIVFRKKEGEQLNKDLNLRIRNIEKYKKEVSKHLPRRSRLQKEKLHESITVADLEIDSNRFEQEILYYLEKLDITEELVRLKAHSEYFLEILKNKDLSKGKKLGFITQEIGREINTIGAKANYADIQKLVVQMKDEVEKIKEQLSNIL